MNRDRRRTTSLERVLLSAALSLSVVACEGSCDGAAEPLGVVRVVVEGAGSGSGTVTVSTPDLPVFDWQCTITNGVAASDCSRDYEAETVDVYFYAENGGDTFVGWSGACSGALSPCRVSASGTVSAVATFEVVVESVELTVNGRGDAANLIQGLMANAVAVARLSNGQVASSATFTWKSSAPSIASVTGSSTGNATVRAESPGTAMITATSGGIESNAVAVNVIPPTSANGVLRGRVLDVDGSLPLDSIRVVGGAIAGSTGETGLSWVSGRPLPLAPGVIPPGGYRFEVVNGTYALASQGVVGSRWVSTPGDTAAVLAGDTTDLDLDIRRGYHLNMLGTDLGTIQAASNTYVNLTVEYQVWSRDLCPGCVPALVVGVDGEALGVFRFPTPGVYPGLTQHGIEIPILVPAQGGTIYAMLATVSTGNSIEPGLQQYRDIWAADGSAIRFVPIGSLQVN